MNRLLPCQLAQRLSEPLPGRRAQSRFEPELSYGRHYAPPPPDARQAAVIALVYPHEEEWYFPLVLRPTSMTDHAGQISLPGGSIEPGESSHAAALRELDEELGIAAADVALLGAMTPLFLFVSNFNVTPWVASIDHRPQWIASPREVDEVLEVPLAHLLDVAHAGQHRRRHAALEFSAPHVSWGPHRIWGATSMILAELADLVAPLLGDDRA